MAKGPALCFLAAVLWTILLFAPLDPVRAAEDSLPDPVSDPFADPFAADEEALFGSDEGELLTEVTGDEAASSLEEDLLVSEGVEAGGSYRFSLGSNWTWREDGALSGGGDGLSQTTTSDLGGTLYFDARPDKAYRVFAKARVDVGEDAGELLHLSEMFADFTLGEHVFVRAGKQTINWGVGYFFSPADIINIGRIDPKDPEAEREGPIAVKVNVPVQSNNLYGYLVADESDGTRLALAPKAEFVVGGTEIGVGAYARSGKAPRLMLTASTGIGPVSFFGEGVVSYGSDKRFLATAPVDPAANPWGLDVVAREDEYFVHFTAGARYAYNDPGGQYDLSGAVQYFLNDEGYETDLFKENAFGVAELVRLGALSLSDLRNPGRRYGALSLNWSRALNSHVSPRLFWIGNLSDGSGSVSLSVGFDYWDRLRPSVGVSRSYGEAGSEFAPGGPMTTLTARVELGSGRF